MLIMEVIHLKMLVISVIKTRQLVFESLDLCGRRATGSGFLTQGFHDSNNERLINDRKWKIAVIVIDKIQLDKL